MEKRVQIPEGVEVAIDGFKVSVSGSKGKIESDFSSPLFNRALKIEKEDSAVKVSSESGKRKIKSQVGCVASHVKNMLKGVKEGYTCKMKIVFLHFPVTVKVSGDEITVSNFLGEKFPRKAKILGETKVVVKGEEITITGIDKKAVGQTAANIERATFVPARDRRVFQDGVFVVEKAK